MAAPRTPCESWVELKGAAILLAAILFGALAFIVLAIRQHFADHRSHFWLLAGLVAAVVCAMVLAALI